MSPRAIAADVRAGVRTVDGRFAAWAALWSVVSLVAFGILSAIIPSPIFVRPIAPEPFAIALWIASAPLMGVIAATYVSRPAATPAATTPPVALAPRADDSRGSTLGSLAGIGAFVAIGCPICNKVALVLLGAGGAMTVFAPIQPFIGAASLGLLLATLVLRFRVRALATCPAVPVGGR